MLQWLCSVYTTKSRFQFYAQMTWWGKWGNRRHSERVPLPTATIGPGRGPWGRRQGGNARLYAPNAGKFWVWHTRFAAKTDLPQIFELNRQACSLVPELMLLIKSEAVSLSLWAAAVVRTLQPGGLVCRQPSSSLLWALGLPDPASLREHVVQQQCSQRPFPSMRLFLKATCIPAKLSSRRRWRSTLAFTPHSDETLFSHPSAARLEGSVLPFRVQPEHAMLRPCPHPFLFHAADCWCSASPGRGPGQRIRSCESCLHARDQSPRLGWPILIQGQMFTV